MNEDAKSNALELADAESGGDVRPESFWERRIHVAGAGEREGSDRRNIWAFGVVVYEMLTGRTMFSGETVSTMAQVI
jgi:serine/threonine protein kinase